MANYKWHKVTVEILCNETADAKLIEEMLNRLMKKAYPEKPSVFKNVRAV